MNGAVLIIDENVNAQIIAETLLRLRGFDVYIAGNPAEADALLAHGNIGVIVVDINGTEINGIAVLQQLRAVAQNLPTRPRLVAITDRHEPELERFTQRLGVDAVLRKPLHPGRFIATVEALVDSAATQAA